MKIAIYNPHMAPNITNMGIHNYIINLIRDGHVSYIFIDQIDKNYTKSAIKRLTGHFTHSIVWYSLYIESNNYFTFTFFQTKGF